MTPFLVLHRRKSVNCLCQMFYGLKCLMNLELIEWKAGCLWEACFPCAAISVCLFCVTSLKQKSYEEKDQCIPCDVSVWEQWGDGFCRERKGGRLWFLLGVD